MLATDAATGRQNAWYILHAGPGGLNPVTAELDRVGMAYRLPVEIGQPDGAKTPILPACCFVEGAVDGEVVRQIGTGGARLQFHEGGRPFCFPENVVRAMTERTRSHSILLSQLAAMAPPYRLDHLIAAIRRGFADPTPDLG